MWKGHFSKYCRHERRTTLLVCIFYVGPLPIFPSGKLIKLAAVLAGYYCAAVATQASGAQNDALFLGVSGRSRTNGVRAAGTARHGGRGPCITLHARALFLRPLTLLIEAPERAAKHPVVLRRGCLAVGYI